MVKKLTIEDLAAMINRNMASKEDLKELATKEAVRELDETIQDEFKSLRQEMREGTRAVLAAIETVEYTKLRIRLDTLEQRMEKVEQKGA
ncbi:MAG: hypothetical protein HY007_00100 [Candidatus Sungbacteria bacterium]|nr:hypothetical protein [Candidatus Sungbacteria bacterium]